jgi:hypothetical protein
MRNIRFWVLVLTMPLMIGCAIGYTRIGKAPEAPLRNYKGVAIPDLSGSDQIPGEVKSLIPDIVAEELGRQNLFAAVDRGVSAKEEPAILLSGRVVHYNPGNRAMRYLTGPLWGVGRGNIIVNVKFVDKASGKEIADSIFEGELKGGIFGGGINETYSKIAEEIVQFVKSNY